MSRGRSRGPFLSSSLGHHYWFHFVVLLPHMLSALHPSADPSLMSPTRVLLEQGSTDSSAHAPPEFSNPSCHSPPHSDQCLQLAGDFLSRGKAQSCREGIPKAS